MSNQFSLLLQSYYSHSFLFLFLVYNFWTTTMFKSECQKSWARGIRERCNVIRESGKLASLAARRLRAELLRGYDNRQGSCVLCVCRWFKGQRTPRQTNPNWHTDRERESKSLCFLQNQLGICVNVNELFFFFCLHSQQTVRGISLCTSLAVS
jgi:hypothetical protein